MLYHIILYHHIISWYDIFDCIISYCRRLRRARRTCRRGPPSEGRPPRPALAAAPGLRRSRRRPGRATPSGGPRLGASGALTAGPPSSRSRGRRSTPGAAAASGTPRPPRRTQNCCGHKIRLEALPALQPWIANDTPMTHGLENTNPVPNNNAADARGSGRFITSAPRWPAEALFLFQDADRRLRFWVCASFCQGRDESTLEAGTRNRRQTWNMKQRCDLFRW